MALNTTGRPNGGSAYISDELYLSPADVEFIAEDEHIQILPNAEIDTLHLIGGQLGPFHPSVVARAPVWLALALKKRRKCKLIPPAWFNAEELNKKLEEEKTAGSELQPIPYNYIEMSSLLLNYARDDIMDAEIIQSAIEDLILWRRSKLRTSLQTLSEGTMALSLRHISAMELAYFRPQLTRVLGHFKQFGDVSQEVSRRAGDDATSTAYTDATQQSYTASANESSTVVEPRVLRRNVHETDDLGFD